MIRQYIERNENIKVLRGRVRMERQIKYNLAHKERLFCQFYELSGDNVHNQVIKYVLRMLLERSIGTIALRQLAELLMRFDSIGDVIVDAFRIVCFKCVQEKGLGHWPADARAGAS